MNYDYVAHWRHTLHRVAARYPRRESIVPPSTLEQVRLLLPADVDPTLEQVRQALRRTSTLMRVYDHVWLVHSMLLKKHSAFTNDDDEAFVALFRLMATEFKGINTFAIINVAAQIVGCDCVIEWVRSFVHVKNSFHKRLIEEWLDRKPQVVECLLATLNEKSGVHHRLLRFHWNSMARDRVVSICLGMQAAGLSVLVLYHIVCCTCQHVREMPMQWLWSVITHVKHRLVFATPNIVEQDACDFTPSDKSAVACCAAVSVQVNPCTST